MTELNNETKDHNNLDELCRIESTCVLPYCGQKIDGRYIPQQLLQRGVQIPVPVARTAINRYIRHARFTCHNWCSQHCFWTVFWILLSSMLWTGVVYLYVYADKLKSRYYRGYGGGYGGGYSSSCTNGHCYTSLYSSGSSSVSLYEIDLQLGLGFVVSYLVLLFLHIGCCVGFRCMSRRSLRQRLSKFNSQLAPYRCLATVVNSKYGCAYYLVFFYYELEPCVKHLAEVLQVQQSYGQPEFEVRRNQIAPSNTQTQTTVFEVSARSMLLEHSAKYLLNFIENDLPDVTSQRHTLQKSCLCQYVQMSLQQTGTGNVLPMMPLQQQYQQHMHDVTVQNV